jgi:hypothetical protein
MKNKQEIILKKMEDLFEANNLTSQDNLDEKFKKMSQDSTNQLEDFENKVKELINTNNRPMNSLQSTPMNSLHNDACHQTKVDCCAR